MVDSVCVELCVFCVKENTAYEVRISDWSSDVCSSDLYRVLRRLPVPAGGLVPMPHMKRAVFLDVETTGLDPNVDDIIELAMVPFWYEDSGRIAGVEIGGSALRQPQKPIPADVTRLTRSEEHTSELQSLMRNSYAVFCLNKKTYQKESLQH